MKPYVAAIVIPVLSFFTIGGSCTPPPEQVESYSPLTFMPDSCSFVGSIDVQIICSTPGATIWYTTDGSMPSETNGVAIATGDTITITSTTTLAAIAYLSGMAVSPVNQATYTLTEQLHQLAQPTFTPDSGSFAGSVDVQISCATAGATIRYTTDGSAPSQSNGTVITNGSSVTISSTTTLAAIAYATGMIDSPIKQATYTQADPTSQVAQPAFSPAGGSFSSSVDVQISCATAGATIRYTTDGSAPSPSNGTVATSGDLVHLTSTTTLAAIAYLSGMIDSPVKQATYTILEQVAQPTFNPDGGSFASSMSVQLSCSTAGATIRYTTDGSTPTSSHGTPIAIDASITLSSTTTLAAVAYQNGLVDSTVKQATYTKLAQVAQPQLTPNGGNFTTSADVQISCSTSGATLRYTTDGSAPSESHGTLTASGGSVHLVSTTTLKAIAYASGMTTSLPASATFTITPPGMVTIAAGEFQMGDPFGTEGDSDERPRHAVSVSEFFMDRYLVTNQQYADALNWAWAQGGLIAVTNGVVYQAGSGTTYPYCDTTTSSAMSRVTWDGSAFGVVSGKGDHPMILVSWYGSVAYANWRSGMQGLAPSYNLSSWSCTSNGGYRLPTEAEWERAARGGVDGHRFPWTDSDIVDHTRANYYSSSGYFYDQGVPTGYDPVFSGSGATMPYTSPVGSFAANAYGLYDMAGNTWEWCNDWFDSNYYSGTPYDNPSGPASGTYRALRGGSWASTAVNLRCAFRSSGLPNYRALVNGFRLVKSAE